MSDPLSGEPGGEGVRLQPSISGAVSAPWGGARPAPTQATRVDFYSTARQYDEHMGPVWDALAEHQGQWYRGKRPPTGPRRLTLVAAYGNLIRARGNGRPIAYMEHGAGFTYADHSTGPPNPFAGGADRTHVELFLDLNAATRERNAATHPNVPGVIVGTPKLDRWFTADPRPRNDPPVVAFSFHWDYQRIPETRWAFPHYRAAIRDLVGQADRVGVRVIGHAHPRVFVKLRSFWLSLGVPFVKGFDDVLDRSDLYVIDTSSTAYEYAATGRPVLLLNAPWYRRNVDHGLRFWRHMPGLAIDDPGQLEWGIRRALDDPPELRAERESAIAAVYPIRDGTSAGRAARALIDRAHELAGE